MALGLLLPRSLSAVLQTGGDDGRGICAADSRFAMSNAASWPEALVGWIHEQLERVTTRPLVLFLGGSQGVGKTTAIRALEAAFPGALLSLSLDDFYLTLAERQALAARVHPLCATRGPPGTHDLAMVHYVIDQVCGPHMPERLQLPVFDKARDDRRPAPVSHGFEDRPRIILVEGWLMGCRPDPQSPQADPINDLERSQDPTGAWRAFQEEQLRDHYAKLWARADAFFYALPSDFAFVEAWRTQQEIENRGLNPHDQDPELAQWVAHFIAHYERLTRRMIEGAHHPGHRVLLRKDRTIAPLHNRKDTS